MFTEIKKLINLKQEFIKNKNTSELEEIYNNAKKFINNLPERKVGRFSVGFTTSQKYSLKHKSDIYISQNSARSVLFIHEFGHVLDYTYGFIDTYNPKYPYYDKENTITEYGKFHVGEDFAEAYRYYFLHSNSFKNLIENNQEITKKYNYFKNMYFFDKSIVKLYNY